MQRKYHSVCFFFIITCLCILFTGCGKAVEENPQASSENLTAPQLNMNVTNTNEVVEPTAENADQEPEIRSSIRRKMIVSELQDDEYIFISCLDVTKELETHKNDTPRENREPANGDESVYIDPNDTSKYQWAPKGA